MERGINKAMNRTAYTGVLVVAERPGHVRDALWRAHEWRRAQQHQHPPARAHSRRPASPFWLQARLR